MPVSCGSFVHVVRPKSSRPYGVVFARGRLVAWLMARLTLSQSSAIVAMLMTLTVNAAAVEEYWMAKPSFSRDWFARAAFTAVILVLVLSCSFPFSGSVCVAAAAVDQVVVVVK